MWTKPFEMQSLLFISSLNVEVETALTLRLLVLIREGNADEILARVAECTDVDGGMFQNVLC
jgi:hypothetical protein